VARHVFLEVDPAIRFDHLRNDGDTCDAGSRLAEVRGAAASLLIAERTALNLLQALSGIATLTRAYVDAAAGGIRVIDTRKTAPMQRALAKYAVRCGGGSNHRVGLFDGVLIKDNHIRVAGSIAEAVRRVRGSAARAMPIEVEAQTLAQVDDALAAGASVIMLDNMDDGTTAAAIARIARRARIELSGNMTLERVRRLASSGADDVSVGALTHSAPAADISFEIDL
jgi:nicotinate-nucleotide pyrophosphorylase (carboxylating)